MTIHYQADNVVLHHGDCIEVMASLPANSVDAVVTDPPYGLEFMGKGWDGADGFRRSLNANDTGRDNTFGRMSRKAPEYRAGVLFQEFSESWARECLRVLKPGGHLLAFGGTRTWHRLAVAVEDAGFEIRDSLAWMHGQGFPKGQAQMKPAFEPVVMGRKPFKGSMVANVAVHGTGSLLIDAARIAGDEDGSRNRPPSRLGSTTTYAQDEWTRNAVVKRQDTTGKGRWPANVMLDEDMAAALDQQTGPLHTQNPATRNKRQNAGWSPAGTERAVVDKAECNVGGHDEKGTGASRFFYVAKAGSNERPKFDGVAHPTVKPLTLMRWLVRLVTPPGGTVLDPFAGSGTTLEAAQLEGFPSIGIEREADYLPLIQARIDRNRGDSEATP